MNHVDSIWTIFDRCWSSFLGNRYRLLLIVSIVIILSNLKTEAMNVVLIVPTGIGAEIGGHAGDANPVAKLIGKCCDKLITHPNVVNASDINEMPENTWYVEGSILDRFLQGHIYLKKPQLNKILVAVNKPINSNTINAINAGKATIGAEIECVELDRWFSMTGYYDSSGKAVGKIDHWYELCEQVMKHDFDALAIQSEIIIDIETKLKYLSGHGGVNPWGGVEAIASKLIAEKLDKPVAHAPFVDWKEDDLKGFHEVVDPRMSAEMVSMCFLHCVLKGLHQAPRIDLKSGLSVNDIDFLITPINCVGPAHKACMKAGIPIIAVKENKNILNDTMPESFIIVENYLEAVGVLMAHEAGITPISVRRQTKINRLEDETNKISRGK